ncbi:hypothetical protein JTE90_013882 [Oedothorax gibbosus]|uniref:Uncharacterized protein n=1 Tax=Oedothorax gibbosus TaxID=931172 RepID=A0AAV6VHF2_9ARAC|nr:hypothetical protein JTE90_013882 [Oedothorax gibbosus]
MITRPSFRNSALCLEENVGLAVTMLLSALVFEELEQDIRFSIDDVFTCFQRSAAIFRCDWMMGTASVMV